MYLCILYVRYVSLYTLVRQKKKKKKKKTILTYCWIGSKYHCFQQIVLSHDVASWSEITPYNKIDKPLVVYRFSGNRMTTKTTLRT